MTDASSVSTGCMKVSIFRMLLSGFCIFFFHSSLGSGGFTLFPFMVHRLGLAETLYTTISWIFGFITETHAS